MEYNELHLINHMHSRANEAVIFKTNGTMAAHLISAIPYEDHV